MYYKVSLKSGATGQILKSFLRPLAKTMGGFLLI